MILLSRTGVYCRRNAGRCLFPTVTVTYLSKSQLSSSQWKKYLTILNVDNNSTAKEIKTSFLKLSKVYHPDNKITGSHAKFVELKQAYDALKDGQPKTTTSSGTTSNYYDQDLSHENLRRYREQYKDFTEYHNYGFGGPYKNSRNPWEDLKREREFRKFRQSKADSFGRRGQPLISLTIILSAVAWIVIYSSALLIFDYNDKLKSGLMRYKAKNNDDYIAYQEYLKRKEAERILNIKQLKKMVEDQRKEEIPLNTETEVVKAL